jgi:hypothetical protein
MLFLIILVQIITALQIRAEAVGPASWVVTRIVLYLVDVNSKDVSLKRRTEMWVDIVDNENGYGTRCLQRTQFPPSPDEWTFCSGGHFYIRARGLSSSTDIEYDLDVVKMNSAGSVSYCTRSRL